MANTEDIVSVDGFFTFTFFAFVFFFAIHHKFTHSLTVTLLP
jgi:hypothetical protein